MPRHGEDTIDNIIANMGGRDIAIVSANQRDMVILDKQLFDDIALIASHANHHRVEGCCDPSWWPASVVLEEGDL